MGDRGQRPLICNRDHGRLPVKLQGQSAGSDVAARCRVPAVDPELRVPEGLGQEDGEALQTHDPIVAEQAVRHPGSLSDDGPARDWESERDDEQQELEREPPERRIECPGLRNLDHPGRRKRDGERSRGEDGEPGGHALPASNGQG